MAVAAGLLHRPAQGALHAAWAGAAAPPHSLLPAVRARALLRTQRTWVQAWAVTVVYRLPRQPAAALLATNLTLPQAVLAQS